MIKYHPWCVLLNNTFGQDNVGWKERNVEFWFLSLTHHILELQIVDFVGCRKTDWYGHLKRNVGSADWCLCVCMCDSVLFVRLVSSQWNWKVGKVQEQSTHNWECIYLWVHVHMLICENVNELMQARITVCIVTRLQRGGLSNCGSYRSNNKRFFFSPNHPYQSWGPSSVGTGALSMWVKQEGHKSDCTSLSRTEVKNVWNYTYILWNALMACTGLTLLLNADVLDNNFLIVPYSLIKQRNSLS